LLEQHGKGQLLFTAHNLRPIETLNKNSILFSTTNPRNRFIHFATANHTKNLRDLYIRSINLGGQAECLYDETSTNEMVKAFASGKLFQESKASNNRQNSLLQN